MKHAHIHFYDDQPKTQDMQDEVIAALKMSPRSLPPKYFYDQRGSQLFDQITDLPEYYVKRTELSILSQHAAEIADKVTDNCLLVEFGSGSSEKIRVLLDSIKPRFYMPLDISKDHLLIAASKLATDFPWIEVHAACVDYSQPVSIPFNANDARKLAFFPGSSLGNLEPEDANKFLRNIAKIVGKNGSLLIGVDLKKDPRILHAAYNDKQGITAAFNLNILQHINEQLNANFMLDNFSHKAHYNEEAGRVEMHLHSELDQIVSIGGQSIQFAKGESIHTENSYKYDAEAFVKLANNSGFKLDSQWSDEQNLFAVFMLTAT